MKHIAVITGLSLLLFGQAYSQTKKKNDVGSKAQAAATQAIFPKGELGSAENFTGKAWHTTLVANDSTYNTLVGNVYFEPGARSIWHTHPAGQILIITDGVGYYQEKGQARRTLRKGDVINACPT